MWYTPSSSACSLNAGAGDNGSQVKSNDGKCWLADFPQTVPPSVQIWGGVGDGTTDSTTALNAGLAWAQAKKAVLGLPYGAYAFSSSLTLPTSSNWGLVGLGTGQSTLKYIGASTTIDLLHFGAPTTFSVGVRLANFRVISATAMTAGCALYMGGFQDGWVTETSTDDQFNSPGKNLWNGYCVDSENMLVVDHYNFYVQNDGVQIYSANGTAIDAYFTHGRVNQATNGFHFSAAGGAEVASSDILSNGTNILLDNALSTNNVASQVRINESVYVDTATGAGIKVNQSVTPTNCQLQFDGWVSGNIGAGIEIVHAPGCIITVDGHGIGYNQGDGVKVDDNSSILNISGNVAGNTPWGVFCVTASTPVRIMGGSVHDNNVVGRQVQNVNTNCSNLVANANFKGAATVTGTTSTVSAVSMGLALTLSVQMTGIIQVTLYGQAANNTPADGCLLGMEYGTGTAPGNGGALGTAIGFAYPTISAAANNNQGFSLSYIVSGLTQAANYWFDGTMQAQGAGSTCTPSNVDITVEELH